MAIGVLDDFIDWDAAIRCGRYVCNQLLRYRIYGPRCSLLRYGARFGFEARASPRQADMIMVCGTITNKMAPVLKRLYDQMADPKYVIAGEGCAAVSGGPFKKSYHVVNGVDKILPVDVYIPGCLLPAPKHSTTERCSCSVKVKIEKYFGGVNQKRRKTGRMNMNMSMEIRYRTRSLA